MEVVLPTIVIWTQSFFFHCYFYLYFYLSVLQIPYKSYQLVCLAMVATKKDHKRCTKIVRQIMYRICLERMCVLGCAAITYEITFYGQCHYTDNVWHVREVATFVPISKWSLSAYQRSINNSKMKQTKKTSSYRIDETSLPESWPNLFSERIKKSNKSTSTRHTHSINYSQRITQHFYR